PNFVGWANLTESGTHAASHPARPSTRLCPRCTGSGVKGGTNASLHRVGKGVPTVIPRGSPRTLPLPTLQNFFHIASQGGQTRARPCHNRDIGAGAFADPYDISMVAPISNKQRTPR